MSAAQAYLSIMFDISEHQIWSVRKRCWKRGGWQKTSLPYWTSFPCCHSSGLYLFRLVVKLLTSANLICTDILLPMVEAMMLHENMKQIFMMMAVRFFCCYWRQTARIENLSANESIFCSYLAKQQDQKNLPTNESTFLLALTAKICP